MHGDASSSSWARLWRWANRPIGLSADSELNRRVPGAVWEVILPLPIGIILSVFTVCLCGYLTGMSLWITVSAGIVVCHGLARHDLRSPLVRYFLAVWVGLTLFELPVRNLLDVLWFGHGVFEPWPLSVREAARPYLVYGGLVVLLATFVWSIGQTVRMQRRPGAGQQA